MLSLALLTSLALSQPAERPAELRSLSVAFTRPGGEPVSGLSPDELVVLENGVAREVSRVERDTRPIDLAVLLDTSAVVGSSYRLNVVDPVLKLLGQLPEGSRYTLYTTGDRPTRVVDLTADRAEAPRALRRSVVQGGNTVLDAIVEASEYLKKKEGGRRAVVVVSAVGVEFSGRDRYQVVDRARADLELFSAILFTSDAPSSEEGPEPRFSYEFVFGELANATGGLLERPLSPLGIEGALARISADLLSRWRVQYATVPEIKERKLELKLARPDVKVRISRSRAEPQR